MTMNKKILIIILSFFLLTGCSTGSPSSDSFSASLKKASTTPYGKYPEKITYTLAQMTGDNNSNMPKGDTYENNAYTRYLLKKLNVQNKDVLRAPDELYFNKIDNIILSKDLPDIMIVEKYEDLKYLHDHDMIADLSEAYKNCASRRVKDMYNSYGSSILENVSFNNKIYAMPETNIDDGPNLFWVREDWLKACHLNTPHTLKDVENIVRTFQKKKMGKTKTTGIMVDTNLTAATGFSSEYLLNLYFAYYNTYPKQWIKKDGKLLYGSIDSNVTKALSHLRSLYNQGILDRNLLLRKGADIAQEIIEENCGAFFGPWWVPNNPLVEALKKNPKASWKPYLIQTDESGYTTYHSVKPSSKYVVVRKGFKHPELIFKISSVIFDYLRYDNLDEKEINDYYALNVDPTARPISINIDYNNALHRSYVNIQKILTKDKSISLLTALDKAYANVCQRYLNNEKTNRIENWAAYASRLEALSLLESHKVRKVNSLYFGNTKTMRNNWWKLTQLEKDAYLQIVTGEKPLSYFSEFVNNWRNQGGNQIVKEVGNEIKEKR